MDLAHILFDAFVTGFVVYVTISIVKAAWIVIAGIGFVWLIASVSGLGVGNLVLIIVGITVIVLYMSALRTTEEDNKGDIELQKILLEREILKYNPNAYLGMWKIEDPIAELKIRLEWAKAHPTQKA